jgi:predicted RNA binding protein YcfA (HicA-like mRNA interferase family)
MPKIKVLLGKDVIRIFEQFGFQVVSQRGSHVKLRRELQDTRQTLTIPLHDEMDRGTLRAIYTQALRYIPEEQLGDHFYIA